MHFSLFEENTQKELNINLAFAVIESFYSADNVNFTSPNQETYTAIKDIYLKKNNRFKALEYHQKEMEHAYKKSSKCSEKILLWLQKCTNDFGLSWTKPFWLLVGLSMFFGLIKLSVFEFDWVWRSLSLKEIGYSLSHFFEYSLESIVVYKKLEKPYSTCSLFAIVYYVKNIVSAFLIYQLISSLRKHSRKL